MLHSEGWELEMDGRTVLVGFITTRCVRGDTLEDAAEAARRDARAELSTMVQPPSSEEPFMRMERITALGRPEKREGFVFYPLDESSTDDVGFRIGPKKSPLWRLRAMLARKRR